ncbi:Peptide methionine sulfoxide reductase MsrA [uncultured archaeon]|nr:Peptide methionine sulfoxide reductase MsrA [uncultured archaeon]
MHKNNMARKTAAREAAIFAGGCFWGVEEEFRKLPGIIETKAGYSGGHTQRPTYEEVCSGTTGHAEAVQIIFDPEKISYDELLKVFWESHDPTTLNRQGPDIGTQYRSAIFFSSQEQQKMAEKSKSSLEKSGKYLHKRIVTQIVPAAEFWPAEEYHQKYLLKAGLESCKV